MVEIAELQLAAGRDHIALVDTETESGSEGEPGQ